MRCCGLTFCLLIPAVIFADIACVFAFDTNLMPDRDTIISAGDDFELPLSFCRNSSMLFAFTLSGKNLFFLGPSEHDNAKKTMSFSLREPDRGFIFSDYYKEDYFIPMKVESVRFISETFGLNDLAAISSAYEENILPDIPHSLNTSVLNDFLNYRNSVLSHDFNGALSSADKIFKMFPEDETSLSFYLYSLMNMADFYTANAKLDSFYKARERSEMYFSLKANLFAIWGKFDIAEDFIERGRFEFPESRMLLTDAINLYSVTDSAKMAELIEFYGETLKMKR